MTVEGIELVKPVHLCGVCRIPMSPILKKDGTQRKKPFNLYCSERCRSEAHLIEEGRKKVLNLPCGTVGTISELEVALDLLRKKYEVYRPVTHNCSGDFIAQKDGKFIKIEVRSAYKNFNNGKLTFPHKDIRSDVLALFVHQYNELRYFSYPSMLEWKP